MCAAIFDGKSFRIYRTGLRPFPREFPSRRLRVAHVAHALNEAGDGLERSLTIRYGIDCVGTAVCRPIRAIQIKRPTAFNSDLPERNRAGAELFGGSGGQDLRRSLNGAVVIRGNAFGHDAFGSKRNTAMISLLISLLVIGLIIGLIVYLVRILPIPAPFGNVIIAVICVIAIIWLLEALVGGGGLSLGLRGPLR